jgi:hypothetical protein
MQYSPVLTLLAAALALVAPPALAQDEAPASGLAIWIRVPGTSAQEFTSASVASPRFAIGFRTGRVQLGIGVGHTTLRVTDRNSFEFQRADGAIASGETEDQITTTLYQIGSAALLDIWRSGDRRTRANIAVGVSLGRLSVTDRNEFALPPHSAICTLHSAFRPPFP